MYEIYSGLACFGMCLHGQNSLSGVLRNLFWMFFAKEWTLYMSLNVSVDKITYVLKGHWMIKASSCSMWLKKKILWRMCFIVLLSEDRILRLTIEPKLIKNNDPLPLHTHTHTPTSCSHTHPYFHLNNKSKKIESLLRTIYPHFHKSHNPFPHENHIQSWKLFGIKKDGMRLIGQDLAMKTTHWLMCIKTNLRNLQMKWKNILTSAIYLLLQICVSTVQIQNFWKTLCCISLQTCSSDSEHK